MKDKSVVKTSAYDIIATVMKMDPDQIQAQHKFTSDLEADSCKRIEILCAIEDRFDIEIDERDAIMIETVGEMVIYIERLLAQ